MKVSALAIARAVASIGKTLPAGDLPLLMDAAASMLIEQGLIRDARIFPDLLKRVWLKEEGAVAATLTTMNGSAGKATAELHSLLESSLKRTCLLEEQADPGILGGMLLSVGDERFDLTLRGALTDLTRTLSAPMA